MRKIKKKGKNLKLKNQRMKKMIIYIKKKKRKNQYYIKISKETEKLLKIKKIKQLKKKIIVKKLVK